MTLKTVFTVSFGVMLVAAIVVAVSHAMVAIALSGSALLLAVSLNHPVQMLVSRGVRRPIAIVLVSLTVLGLIVGFGFTLIPPAVEQGKQLIRDAPQFIRSARGSIFRSLDARFHLGERLLEIERRLPDMLEGAATPILTAVGGVLSAVGAAVTIAFLTVFMMIFGGRLIRGAVPKRGPTTSPCTTPCWQNLPIDRRVPGRADPDLLDQRHPHHDLPGDRRRPLLPPPRVLSGLSSMVPYAGPLLAGTAISLLALLTKGVGHGVASGIYFIAYGQVEGNILGPLIFAAPCTSTRW